MASQKDSIVDISVEEEMESAYLEYAYSVIHSRAIPDARDGLKPVQRRILFAMDELGLRPERGHVKSSRVIGEVMGKYHPHGDQAIYDALVRMAQPFTMRLPLVDGHGNFGSLDDGPAAARYTEARLAGAAMLLTTSLEENTVEFVPNYDDQFTQPEVLPAAYPNLLVNGASGIAVGMATNLPPHNLTEVIAAARHLLAKPDCTLAELMKFVPGPDLPLGGQIVGLDGIREAYLSGRGSFRTRATVRIEKVSARRQGIVVTELPFLVGPEKVIERIKDLHNAKKLDGIADVKDLSDRSHGLQLVIEVKNGFNPEAVLENLYRLTPLEESFGINNVALVAGQPRTLGLKELLSVYVDFRIDVVLRRTTHRLERHERDLHLLEGLLIAILDIDEVIQIVRSSDDVGIARQRLRQVFDLSEPQATYILDLQLRRLTKFSQLELEKRRDELLAAITDLRAVLQDETVLRRTVSDELAAVAKEHGTPRRTVLLESAGGAGTAPTPLEVADDPCHVLLSSTGLLARTSTDEPLPTGGARRKHDTVTAAVSTTARGDFGVLTCTGRLVRVGALDLPTLAPSSTAPVLSGGIPLAALVDLAEDEQPVALVSLDPQAPPLAIGTRSGVVKRVAPDHPARESFTVIALKDGDQVVGAAPAPAGSELVFLTDDAQLLHFSADLVRPQGRSAAGMAGVRLGEGARVIFFGVVHPGRENVVVTLSGSSGALPGTDVGAVKLTPFQEYPAKGRATGGVRCHRLARGQETLVLGWVGPCPARAAGPGGTAVELPAPDSRRDGPGTSAAAPIAAISGPEPSGIPAGS